MTATTRTTRRPGRTLFLSLGALALLGTVPPLHAQYSITRPRGRVELEARLRTAWHHRWLFPGDEDHNKDRFYVESARFKLSGQQYRHRMAWEMQLEMRGYNGLEREDGQEMDHQGIEARDLHLSWVPNDFLPGRDRGLMVRARTPVRDWTAWAGVFTGNGENHKYDDPAGKPLWAVRLEWAPWGELGGEEGDFDHTPRPRLLAGVNVASSHDRAPALEDPRDYLRTIDGKKQLYGADLSAKWRGGWVLEPVVAYDEFNPDHTRADDTQRGLTTGLNLMPDGHDLKIMLDWLHRFKLRSEDENPWKEDELRLVVQLRVL